MTTEAKDPPKTDEPSTDQKQEPKQEAKKPAKTLADMISQRTAAFKSVASDYMPAERLVRLAQLVVAKTPKLAKCTPLSVIDSLMVCARLGLEPHEPGGVWLVPYENKAKDPDTGEWRTVSVVCTPITDYRGLLDVCRRSKGVIKAVHAAIRYEKDEWEFYIDASGDTMVKLFHKPAEGDRGAKLGAYFIARLESNEAQAVYLTVAEIEEYRKRSKNAKGKNSPWERDWNAMAMKTAVRRGVNLLPRTPEIQLLRETLHREDAIDLEPGSYKIERDGEIPMPRRIGEKAASPSPSAPPPPDALADAEVEDDNPHDEPESVDTVEAPSSDSPIIKVKAIRKVSGTRGGQDTAEVIAESGEIFKVSMREVLPYLEVAAQSGSRVQVAVDKGEIVEIERVFAPGQ